MQSGFKIIYSTVAARIISGIFNYNANKKAVFQNKEKNFRPFLKYIALFLMQMTLSSISVHMLANIKTTNATLLKIIVDTTLFLFSFIIQKIFVFKPNEK
jgi:dolichol-phosphate mannosyltransferase